MTSVREPWFLAYERAVSEHYVLRELPVRLPEPLEPEQFALVHDVVDTTAAFAGQILKPNALSAIASAVVQLFGALKSPAAQAPTPTTGDPSNP